MFAIVQRTKFLIAVAIRLERTLHRDSNVVSLLLGQNCEFGSELSKMETGNFLVELLGEQVDLLGVLARGAVCPELNLSESLVGEGAGHHKARVASGASEIQQATLSEDDDSVLVGEHKAIDLGLDVLANDSGPLLQTEHVTVWELVSF